jgi:cellulose synthase/poly-beta-1,6-N-acetylglucosamine synthase-like glycosyltransferase
MTALEEAAVAAVALSLGFTLYVLFGYPLLLGFLARRRSRPVRRVRSADPPSVSILIAVHNGEGFLREKLESILALDYPRDRVEVLIASDGSTDATNAIVKSVSGVQLLELPRGGKPAALNAAMARARHDIFVFTDVRQSLARDSLAYLIENFADSSVGAVSGELVILKGDTRQEADTGLYWRYELWIRTRLSEIDSIFGATGAYYALRRELAAPIPHDALLDDMHLPLGAFFRGYRLIVDSRARMFDLPTGLESEFRRKVRTLAGNYQILRAYPELLGPRNRLWLHFVSYKLGRLLLPFALLACLIASGFLPSPWNSVLLGSQAGFYGIALLDLWIPEGFVGKRITSPARTFVTLMAASACAPSILFVPSARFWKSRGVPQSK